jgi:hypothetical protein
VCNHRCLGGTARAPPVRSVTTRRTQEPAHARGYALGRTAAQVDTVRNSAKSACSGRGPYIDRSCTRDSPLVSFSVMPKPSAIAARVRYENVDWFKMSQVSLRDRVLTAHRVRTVRSEVTDRMLITGPRHVGAGNSVTAVDLVSSAEPGKIKLGIWLRGSHALGHFQYSCYYDSPTS